MSIHDDLTAPSLGLPATIPGGPGSGIRPVLSPEEELAAAMRDVGRARGESSGWGVRPVDEVCGFELRRAFQAYLKIGDNWVMHGQVCGTYDLALESVAWPALRLRAWAVNGARFPFEVRP